VPISVSGNLTIYAGANGDTTRYDSTPGFAGFVNGAGSHYFWASSKMPNPVIQQAPYASTVMLKNEGRCSNGCISRDGERAAWRPGR